MSKFCVPLKYLSAARPDITHEDAVEVSQARHSKRLKWLSALGILPPHSQEKANFLIKNVWFYFMSKQESIVYRMITVTNLNVFLISGDKNTLQLSKSHLSSGCWFNVALSCAFWVLFLYNTT